MTGRDIYTLRDEITKRFSGLCDLAVACAGIGDHYTDLFEEEQRIIAEAAPKRRREFAAGRSLARQAMSTLGLPTGPVLRGSSREPIWPDGTVGSLTHTDDCAVACIASSARIRSVGVDLEIADRVEEQLYSRIFTDYEQKLMESEHRTWAGLCFSAKEAGYKATFPIARRFIGFQEAEVIADFDAGTFGLKYVGPNPENRVMEEAEGYFLCSGKYVFSLVVLS